MTLPPPGQPRRWPMHRERYSPQDTARHVTERLAAARRDEHDPTGGNTAWRIGHHAGRLFALRERSREEYEARVTPAAGPPPTPGAPSPSSR